MTVAVSKSDLFSPSEGADSMSSASSPNVLVTVRRASGPANRRLPTHRRSAVLDGGHLRPPLDDGDDA